MNHWRLVYVTARELLRSPKVDAYGPRFRIVRSSSDIQVCTKEAPLTLHLSRDLERNLCENEQLLEYHRRVVLTLFAMSIDVVEKNLCMRELLVLQGYGQQNDAAIRFLRYPAVYCMTSSVFVRRKKQNSVEIQYSSLQYTLLYFQLTNLFDVSNPS